MRLLVREMVAVCVDDCFATRMAEQDLLFLDVAVTAAAWL